jgi:thiol-disulfide isomerase/thioredoxin
MKVPFFIAIIFFINSFTFAKDFTKNNTFYNLKDEKISYDEIIAYPNTILFLWTSWCPYCRKELLRLNRNCAYYKDVEFLYINLGENKTKVEKVISRLKLKKCISTKILLDKEGALGRKFSIIGVPAFIFLKKGIPIYKSYFINEELIKVVFGDE